MSVSGKPVDFVHGVVHLQFKHLDLHSKNLAYDRAKKEDDHEAGYYYTFGQSALPEKCDGAGTQDRSNKADRLCAFAMFYPAAKVVPPINELLEFFRVWKRHGPHSCQSQRWPALTDETDAADFRASE